MKDFEIDRGKSRHVLGILTLIVGYISLVVGVIGFVVGFIMVCIPGKAAVGGITLGSSVGCLIEGYFALGVGDLFKFYDGDIEGLQKQISDLKKRLSATEGEQFLLQNKANNQEKEAKAQKLDQDIQTSAQQLVDRYAKADYPSDEERLTAMLEEANKGTIAKAVFLKAVDLMGYTLDQASIDAIPDDE